MECIEHPHHSLMCQQSQAFQSFLLVVLVACQCLEITSKAGIKCNTVLVHVCAFVLQCSCACAWNMCNIGTSQDYKPTSLRSQKAVASVWAKCAQPFPMEAPQHNLNERFRNISNTKQCTLALSQRRRHCTMCDEGIFATKVNNNKAQCAPALLQWRQTCVKCF